jgi:hypothetical protein
MLERMKARSSKQPDTAKPAEPAKPAEAAKVEEPTAPADQPPADEDLLEEGIGKSQPVEKPVTEPEKTEVVDPKNPKAKVNPWKLVDEHKAARAKAEAEVVELKKLTPNMEARKAEMAEIEAVKKRNQELEEHIKFVDFKQSKEYKETYEKPYVDQWKNSMRELDGVTVSDESGSRIIEPGDLLQLVNMPTVKARALAQEIFGEFAEDAMRERDKIVSVHNAKLDAENRAKQTGVTKFSEMSKAQQEAMEALNSEVKSTYESAVQSIKSSPANKEFFEPIEGDDEANVILNKGYEMVDRAFSQNPMDPQLTKEQRASITKLHAAIRHRSAGYGRVKHLLAKERTVVADLRKKLAQYESTVPNRGPAATIPSSTSNGGSKMGAMQARLRAMATKSP